MVARIAYLEAGRVNRLRRSAVAILSAIGLGAFAVWGLHAQGASTVAAPLQPNRDYAFASPTWCLNLASASCRRKPRSPSPSNINADFDGNFVASVAEGGGASLRVQGDATEVRLDAHRVQIKAVLAALSTALDFSCHFTMTLDDAIDGTYVGSLRHVLSRVLDGYDYVIKQESSKLEVIVIGRSGARALPVTTSLNPYHALRERRRAALLRIDQRQTSSPSSERR
jgi:hypothetical protein